VWSPADSLSCTACPFPFIQPTVSKQFTVTTTDAKGCYNHSIVTIKILEQYSVDVPTAFSPNGDGTNDVIYVDGWGIKQLLEFKIYNRWGELLFESNDLKVGWDGKYKGEIQNVETYAYTVVAAMYSNTPPITKKGFIKIIK
jgi:gliding motility-associated-like protein